MKLPPTAPLVLADPSFPRLKEHVIAATGLAYFADKDADLAGRVAERLQRTEVNDCDTYLTLLADGARGEAERDALIEELTIGETFFFRHQEMFNALRDIVLPVLLRRNMQSRHVRIWSAGCSTGAEAYSLSILLRRDLAALCAGWDVTILGTDINRRFLARAGAAEFDEWAFRATPAEVKHACFVPVDKAWRLRPEYREGVSFQYHNLVTDHFPSRVNNLFAFDLILCRNVTIYFSVEIVRRLIEHFRESLVEGGWLLVGHAEPNLEWFQSFRTVNAPGAVLYQKAPPEEAVAAAPSFAWLPPVLPWLTEPASPSPAPPPPSAAVPEVDAIRTLADRGDWEKAAQSCVDVLARKPLCGVVYFYHALVLEQLGQHAAAESALRRALYLDRQFILAHYYLGLLLQKQGDLQRAARSFQNVLQLLSRLDGAFVFAEGDGITAAELHRLTQMHLAVLEGA